MRPAILYPLFAQTTTLKGVGPRFGKLFEKLTGPRLVDLLWHLPASLIDRSYAPQLVAAESGRVVTLKLEVLGHNVPRNPRQPHRVKCHDGTAAIDLVFFHVQGDYLARLLPEGSFRVVSGKLETFGGGWQITHPDYVVPLEEAAKLPKLEAVYPLTAGLSNKQVGKAIAGALGKVPALAEWIDPTYLARQGWPSFSQALKLAHQPASTDDLSPLTPARQRLAFDELLANQLALALVRARQKRARGKSLRGDGKLRNRVLDILPFRLTGAQQRAIQEILGDMADETRMLRLLQGDVGSGKTLVALMALLTAVEAGGQGALMAPTEILARQHFETLQPLCLSVGVGLELITGRDKGRNREGILQRIAEGQARIVVGTHAVFQEDVLFKNLLLAVVDEQHRFGVHQRLALAEKGEAVDILVMTATPIPRTLTLTLYGDMDVSRLDEKPPGRLPIDTRVVPLERLEETIAAVGRGMAQGRQVYWVCPLVEDSELIDLAAAKERFAELNARFPGQVGLIHGSMKGKEKDTVMAAFAAGQLKLLVATTVIEVGVNVPAASVMVVEHAERFGLAQLHQLRGRVGRGTEKSICLLIYGQPLGEVARQRLEVMRASEDGFFIAEEDLRLRGGGEVLGTKQSGFPEFRLADLSQHVELLAAARDDARLQLSRDPGLEGERGKQLRTLLYLFERDEAVRLLKAG